MSTKSFTCLFCSSLPVGPADRSASGARDRCGRTYAPLAAGFGVGTTTVYRYVTEAVEVLATAVKTASAMAFVILDGMLLPIDRIAADRPYCSGNHHKRGMSVQVLADRFGRLL